MNSDEMLVILEKICTKATVVPLSIGNCFRIYLGDVVVTGATLPSHRDMIHGDYWTVDAGTEEIAIARAYDRLYFELSYWCDCITLYEY